MNKQIKYYNAKLVAEATHSRFGQTQSFMYRRCCPACGAVVDHSSISTTKHSNS